MIEKVKIGNEIYHVINDIDFIDTKHYLVRNGDKIKYINIVGNKITLPSTHLFVEENEYIDAKQLYFIRKQLLLNSLIDYINENNICNTKQINEIVDVFNAYVKEPDIGAYIFSAYLSKKEFNDDSIQKIKELFNKFDLKLEHSEEIKHEK